MGLTSEEVNQLKYDILNATKNRKCTYCGSEMFNISLAENWVILKCVNCKRILRFEPKIRIEWSFPEVLQGHSV